jgi:gluconate 5-dehydrogenase
MMRDLFDLTGQVALVAGGTGGIGRAICLGLAEFGADVVVVGRSAEKGAAIAGEIEGTGRRAIALQADLTRPDDVNRLVGTVTETWGQIDILVNSVGTNRRFPAETFTEADWNLVMDVNLKGAFLLTQAVGRAMIPRRRGKIIHISSIRGELGHRLPYYTAYCASKAGMNMLTKQLAVEWARYNIHVNAIAPGWTVTPLAKQFLEDQAFTDDLLERTPLGRWAQPEDMVGATIFLASRASDFVTGQILTVDGGITARQ